jgi:hypothetical protein
VAHKPNGTAICAYATGYLLLTNIGSDVDREVYVGSPLCIQVVAPKLQEEKLVQAMSAIDAALKAEQPLSAKL